MKKTKSPLTVFKGVTKDKTTLQCTNLCYFIRSQQHTGEENEKSGSIANHFEPDVVCGHR